MSEFTWSVSLRLQITNVTKHQKKSVFSSKCEADFLKLLLFFTWKSEREQKKKNRTSLFCLFNFRSDVHERPKDSRYLHVCSGQRWRYQRKCAALLPKYETQISIVRFAGDIFTLNFAAGSVICYRCTPSILAPIWSLQVRLVEGLQRYEGGLFFKKKPCLVEFDRRSTFYIYSGRKCPVWHAGSYTVTYTAPIHYIHCLKKNN